MTLRLRRTIYRQVCLPNIGYMAKTWYPDLKFKHQHERLTRVQRRMLLALTRAYRTTSNAKLQKIMGVLDLNEEFELALESERKCGKGGGLTYDERADLEWFSEIQTSTGREIVWFLTGHGPFRSYLFRFGLSKESTCRLCKSKQTETPEHLVRECEQAVRPINIKDIGEVETCLRELVRKLLSEGDDQ